MHDNEKLNKEFEEFKIHNTIVLENLDHDGDLILENEKLKEENKKLKEERNNVALKEDKSSDALKEENKKLKLEKEHLKIGLSKFTRGKYLQSELLMNTVMKMDRSGIRYMANKKKKAQAQQQQQKPKPKKYFECGQDGHFAHECQTPPPQPLPKHARHFAFNAHYMLRKDSSGKTSHVLRTS